MKLVTRKDLEARGISESTIIHYRAGYYLRNGQKIWYYPDHRTLTPAARKGRAHYYRLRDVIAYKKDYQFRELL